MADEYASVHAVDTGYTVVNWRTIEWTADFSMLIMSNHISLIDSLKMGWFFMRNKIK